MTEADLAKIEKAARRGLGASCAETLALGDEVRRLWAEVEQLRTAAAPFVQPCWRDGRYVAVAIQDQWAAAVAALEAALAPPTAESNR
jgi:hypothetical protein